ncbi:MAG: hypothetical protein K2X81_23435, partial [Candidatus Obscuribacterales bacterium]|nr:hypothetical protein [Candidatus Obscuribacterales bacterium]
MSRQINWFKFSSVETVDCVLEEAALMFTQVLKAFAPKPKVESFELGIAKDLQSPVLSHDEIVATLLAKYDAFRGITADTHDIDSNVFTSKSNQYMYINNDRSYLLRDSEGKIVKTSDVLRRVKEYRTDENGKLLVKKFGIWSELAQATLKEDGTLIWRNADGETHECLNGTQIYISFKKNCLVAHNEFTGEDVSITSKNEIRHRFLTEGVEQFRLYRDALLITETESFESPISGDVKTMAEVQKLDSVSRIERQFENDKIASESYFFLDEQSGSRAVRLCLNLPTGELHLSKVSRLDNVYRDGQLAETIYELSDPVSVSRDKEGNVSLIRGISKVRRFLLHDFVFLVFLIVIYW